MSFLILVLYMLRLQNPGDLNTDPKIFKDGVAPELMMLRTLEILHAGRELGLGLQVFSGRFFSGASIHKQAKSLLPDVFLVPALNRFSFGSVPYQNSHSDLSSEHSVVEHSMETVLKNSHLAGGIWSTGSVL